MFYDFCIHPDDPRLIQDIALQAKKYGYSGITLVNMAPDESFRMPDNFSVYRGTGISGISGKPYQIKEEVKKQKGSDILIVEGGEEDINRAAVESGELDILLQPVELNNVIAKFAGDNSIAIGFNIGSIIHLRGEARARELNIMRNNLKHSRKYELSMILVSNSHSSYDIRSPREMAALAGIFGLTEKEAVEAMSKTPLDILKRKNPNYVQNGIEII